MNLRTSLGRAAVLPTLVGLAITASAVVPGDVGTVAPTLRLATAAPQPTMLRRAPMEPILVELPVDHYVLTARFGEVSGLWQTVHTGLDFAAPEGTPIHAVAEGVVTATGYDGSYGNKTTVRLDDGTVLWFCHQSRFVVSVGQRVEPGQVIGLIGATGNVTGPHLHLEVHPHGGAAVDPDTWLRRQGLRP